LSLFGCRAKAIYLHAELPTSIFRMLARKVAGKKLYICAFSLCDVDPPRFFRSSLFCAQAAALIGEKVN
jgi:hypothetical protein